MTDKFSDEQRVRDAMDYEIEPWVPDTRELMRRGRRHAWFRRGLATAAIGTLAGAAASVALAVGGTVPQSPPVGGNPTPSPAGTPEVPLQTPQPTTPPGPNVTPTPVPTTSPRENALTPVPTTPPGMNLPTPVPVYRTPTVSLPPPTSVPAGTP